jgi:hypothetical protein
MKTIKIAFPAAILMAGFLVCTTASYGKPEYSKKTGKNCVYCHVKAGSKALNPTGECYKKASHSLENCPAPTSEKK